MTTFLFRILLLYDTMCMFSATERVSENMHIVANEPSLAFYRLQEHVRKALPPMVERRVDVTKLHNELQGRCYDVEYAVRQVALFVCVVNLFHRILFHFLAPLNQWTERKKA